MWVRKVDPKDIWKTQTKLVHWALEYFKKLALKKIFKRSLREKYPNTEFFLVRIFPHSDWTRYQKELCIWTHFTQLVISQRVGQIQSQNSNFLNIPSIFLKTALFFARSTMWLWLHGWGLYLLRFPTPLPMFRETQTVNDEKF